MLETSGGLTVYMEVVSGLLSCRRALWWPENAGRFDLGFGTRVERKIGRPNRHHGAHRLRMPTSTMASPSIGEACGSDSIRVGFLMGGDCFLVLGLVWNMGGERWEGGGGLHT